MNYQHHYDQTDDICRTFNSIGKKYGYVKGFLYDSPKIPNGCEHIRVYVSILAFFHYHVIGFDDFSPNMLDVFLTNDEYQQALIHKDRTRQIIGLFWSENSSLNYFLIGQMPYYLLQVLRRSTSQCFKKPLKNIAFYHDSSKFQIKQGQGIFKLQFLAIMTESANQPQNFGSIFRKQQHLKWKGVRNCISFGLINKDIPLIEYQNSKGTFFQQQSFLF